MVVQEELEIAFNSILGSVEYAEKENVSNDKKIVYLINDKKNDNRKDMTS